jgi:hypothetical protein
MVRRWLPRRSGRGAGRKEHQDWTHHRGTENTELEEWALRGQSRRVPSRHRRYREASQNPCGWLGVRRWREETPASVDAKRPLSTGARTKASTAALAQLASRSFLDGQRRALGHPAGFWGLSARRQRKRKAEIAEPERREKTRSTTPTPLPLFCISVHSKDS